MTGFGLIWVGCDFWQPSATGSYLFTPVVFDDALGEAVNVLQQDTFHRFKQCEEAAHLAINRPDLVLCSQVHAAEAGEADDGAAVGGIADGTAGGRTAGDWFGDVLAGSNPASSRVESSRVSTSGGGDAVQPQVGDLDAHARARALACAHAHTHVYTYLQPQLEGSDAGAGAIPRSNEVDGSLHKAAAEVEAVQRIYMYRTSYIWQYIYMYRAYMHMHAELEAAHRAGRDHTRHFTRNTCHRTRVACHVSRITDHGSRITDH